LAINRAIGGISREFYENNQNIYDDPRKLGNGREKIGNIIDWWPKPRDGGGWRLPWWRPLNLLRPLLNKILMGLRRKFKMVYNEKALNRNRG